MSHAGILNVSGARIQNVMAARFGCFLFSCSAWQNQVQRLGFMLLTALCTSRTCLFSEGQDSTFVKCKAFFFLIFLMTFSYLCNLICIAFANKPAFFPLQICKPYTVRQKKQQKTTMPQSTILLLVQPDCTSADAVQQSARLCGTYCNVSVNFLLLFSEVGTPLLSPALSLLHRPLGPAGGE